MQTKKSPKADLQSKRSLFFQAGIVISLAAVIWVFSWGTKEKTLTDVKAPKAVVEVDPVYIPRTAEPQNRTTAAARVITEVQIWNIVPDIAPPSIEIGEMPDIDEIFNAPTPTPVIFEKPQDENEVFYVSEEMPKFRGGNLDDFRRWVLSNIVYPEAALVHGIAGRVRIEFIVEKDGTISSITVVESPDRLLSEAAMKVVEKSPEWEPGKQRNKPVRVKFNMPVDFRINQNW